MKNLIESEWDKFFSMVWPEGCPQDQKRDLQICFYAGALSSLLTATKNDEFNVTGLIAFLMDELNKMKNEALERANETHHYGTH